MVCRSGLFVVAETDDEIAAAIGHQVAHVLAHHIQATKSAQLLGNLALSPVLPFLIASSVFGWLRFIAAPPMAFCGRILRALSQEREAEANRIGMLLMTEAGFVTSATVTYWEKQNKYGQERLGAQNRIQTAEDTSTNHHVSLATRVNNSERLTIRGPKSAMSLSQAASQATLEIPKVLYITGKGPLHPGMSTSEVRDLEESKRRWKIFLAQRPTHDGDVDSGE